MLEKTISLVFTKCELELSTVLSDLRDMKLDIDRDLVKSYKDLNPHRTRKVSSKDCKPSKKFKLSSSVPSW